MPNPISLKFGTQNEGLKAHLGTNFGWNTINRQRVMSDYSRKIAPIYCHAYRVNRVCEEAENRWMNRLTIEPQTFCSLKEIEVITRKIQRKNQQCVTITQSRLANKKTSVAPICIIIIFTFTDTDVSLIPVADMPIFTDILLFCRSGEKEQKSSKVYVRV